MIIEIPPNNKIIPHIENILNIHNSHPILNSLNEFNPLIAGGYPMALLFAPRKKEDSNQITIGYYSDYDIYFQSHSDLQNAMQRIEKDLPDYGYRKYETSNAISYTLYDTFDPILGEEKPTQLQFVRKLKFPPKQCLSTFDFINCAIGFTPKTKSFFVHKEAFLYHNNKELEILDPWMLNEITEENISNVIIQLARFKKYCIRWEYTLGSKAFDKLISVYESYPELKVEKDMRITQIGGVYDQTEWIALRNQNVWEVIAPYIRAHEKWRTYNDTIGILSEEKKDEECMISF